MNVHLCGKLRQFSLWFLAKLPGLIWKTEILLPYFLVTGTCTQCSVEGSSSPWFNESLNFPTPPPIPQTCTLRCLVLPLLKGQQLILLCLFPPLIIWGPSEVSQSDKTFLTRSQDHWADSYYYTWKDQTNIKYCRSPGDTKMNDWFYQHVITVLAGEINQGNTH